MTHPPLQHTLLLNHKFVHTHLLVSINSSTSTSTYILVVSLQCNYKTQGKPLQKSLADNVQPKKKKKASFHIVGKGYQGKHYSSQPRQQRDSERGVSCFLQREEVSCSWLQGVSLWQTETKLRSFQQQHPEPNLNSSSTGSTALFVQKKTGLQEKFKKP